MNALDQFAAEGRLELARRLREQGFESIDGAPVLELSCTRRETYVGQPGFRALDRIESSSRNGRAWVVEPFVTIMNPDIERIRYTTVPGRADGAEPGTVTVEVSVRGMSTPGRSAALDRREASSQETANKIIDEVAGAILAHAEEWYGRFDTKEAAYQYLMDPAMFADSKNYFTALILALIESDSEMIDVTSRRIFASRPARLSRRVRFDHVSSWIDNLSDRFGVDIAKPTWDEFVAQLL